MSPRLGRISFLDLDKLKDVLISLKWKAAPEYTEAAYIWKRVQR